MSDAAVPIQPAGQQPIPASPVAIKVFLVPDPTPGAGDRVVQAMALVNPLTGAPMDTPLTEATGQRIVAMLRFLAVQQAQVFGADMPPDDL